MAPSNIHCDGELMHQITPCMPIGGTQGHHVVRDLSSGHMVFSIGDSGELFLLRPDGFNARYSLLDLRPCLGISTSTTKATALAVSQDSDRQVFIAFVTESGDSKRENQLWVLSPQSPAVYQGLGAEDNLTSAIIRGQAARKNARLEKLFLSDVRDRDSYPVLVCTYRRLDRNVLDAMHIQVDMADKSWDYNAELQLPEDPGQAIDIACGRLPTGDSGLFYLYRVQGVTTLSFYSTTTPGITFALQVRQDATALATFENNDGDTDLIVASGHELHHYTAFVCAESRVDSDPPAYNVICQDALLLSGLQQLRVSYCPGPRITSTKPTTPARLTVFALDEDSTVLYQEMNVAVVDSGDPNQGFICKVTPGGKATPLLTVENASGRFAALLEPDTGNHKLFVVSNSGSVMTLLEQSSVTKLWQSLTVLVPSTGENREVITFTSHVKVLGPDGDLAPRRSVLLKASSPVDLAVNGKPQRVTTKGVAVTTDEMSTLTIIHNVSDISTVKLIITDVPDAEDPVLGGESVAFDSSQKVQAKLKSLVSGPGGAERLRSVALPGGEKLISGDIKDEDVDSAAAALDQLCEKIDQLNFQQKPCQDSNDATSGDLETGPHVGASASGVLTNSEPASWGLWHWLTSLGSKIKRWFISAWDFVVETTKGVFRFILKSVSHAMKAITFVFKQIGVGLKKLGQSLAFLFDWNDILDMRTVLANVLNTCIDSLGSALDIFGHAAGEMFDEVDGYIAKMDKAELASKASGVKPSQSKKLETSEGSNVLDSPGGNWGTYQMQHGDVGTTFKTADTSPGRKRDGKDTLSTVWTEVLEPLLDSIGELMRSLGLNVLELFKNKDASLGDLLKHLGVDLLRGFLRVVRSFVVGILNFSSILTAGLKEAMNAPIEIPLLSALYRKISGGKSLSIMDAVCLLVAIPSTVLYKAVTGKRIRDDPEVLAYIEGKEEFKSSMIPEKSLVGLSSVGHNSQRAQGRQMSSKVPTTASVASPFMNLHAAPGWTADTESAMVQSKHPPKSLLSIDLEKLDYSGKDLPIFVRPVMIVWDDLCKLVRELEWTIKVVIKLIPFCMPFVNMCNAYMAPASWFIPDVPGGGMAAPPGSQESWSVPGKFGMGIGILSCLGSFPLDSLNGMFTKPIVTPRPGVTPRVIHWLLGLTYIPALVCLRRKRAVSLVQGCIAVVQIPFAVWSIVADLSAGDEEYPGRDQTTLILSGVDKGCAQIARVALAVASHGNFVTPPAQVGAAAAMLFSFVSPRVQVAIVVRDAMSGSYHELASLLGL